MTDNESNAMKDAGAPTAVKKTRKERGFAPIWIVPIVAVLIGLFLVYRVVSEAGPTITISFKAGSGLEAGKTKVKFKDVEIGSVSAIDLNPDLSGVIVTVALNKVAKKYLTENSRFWVVRPRINGGSVSGLETLLSGAYISVDPSTEGKKQKKFTGLERPPVIQFDEPGTRFKLSAERLGGLNFGAPVYFKQIRAGEVTDYNLQDDGMISLEIFVRAPYDKNVNQATRFWNAGGVDVTLDAHGLQINTEPLLAILAGGISFDTKSGLGARASAPVDAEHEFILYASKRASKQKKFKEKHRLVMYFEDPVHGLLPGAPVQLRGFQIGEVVDVSFEFDRDISTVRIPVIVDIEPERITMTGKSNPSDTLNALVTMGLRAQLKTSGIVFGKLLVDLDFHPDAAPAEVIYSGEYPVFPTIEGALGEILENTGVLVAELREIGKHINDLLTSQELQSGLTDLSVTLAHVRGLSRQLDETLAPELSAILIHAEVTMSEAQSMLATNSATRTEINRMLTELGDAARSIRLLADYLEQNPEALLRGKE